MEYVNTQLTEPATEPLTLAQAKKHLAIDHTDDDTLITRMIIAARQKCETQTGRIWGQRTFRLQFLYWPTDGYIRIPIEPVASVTNLKYYDTDSVLQTVTASLYDVWLEHSPPLIYLKSGFTYPTIDPEKQAAIAIEYVAGETVIPALLEQAMELILGYWQQFPGGEPTLGHLSRGLPVSAINALDSLWTGAL